MAQQTRSHFYLTDAAKADHTLIADDDAFLARIENAVAQQLAAALGRLDALRAVPARAGREAAERDSEIRTVTAQVALLRRSGAHLCLGRMTDDSGTRIYLGRRGISDAGGHPLLLDWRTPAAAPFFTAARDQPFGLVSRRRYRWSGDRVVDYWDEALTNAALDTMPTATLDAQSSFLAALSRSRSTTMDDVLATLAADQSAILRDGSTGTLVVDGGPGTGKTVVALHRAAYLLYADSRVSAARGGVLFIGPTSEFLNYVAGVLPDLGTEGTRFATLRDLVDEGAGATEEADPRVAALKSRLTGAIGPAVAFYQDVPDRTCTVETVDGLLTVTPADWAVAIDQLEPDTPHNQARPKILEALADYIAAPIAASTELRALLRRAWPLIDATDLIGDLWTVPAFLRHCAPELTVDEVRALARTDPSSWTTADLPLLDTARSLLGDKDFESRNRRRSSSAAEQSRVMTDVIDQLVAADDDHEGLVQQFAFGGRVHRRRRSGAGPEGLPRVLGRPAGAHGSAWHPGLPTVPELPDSARSDGLRERRNQPGAAGRRHPRLDPQQRNRGTPMPRRRAAGDRGPLAGRQRGHRVRDRYGAVARYIAMTRATAELVVAT